MAKPKYDAMMLRTCNPDMTSHGGFRWPKRGPVVCPDWQPTAECGHGLHGLAWGEGRADLLSWDEPAVWQCVRYVADEAIDLGGKIKIPRGYVALSGSRADVTRYLYRHAPAGTVIHGLIIAGGDRATVSGGDMATVTGGNWATVTGGNWAMLSLRWHDGNRYRIAVGYVGEDGIEAGVAYRCEAGKFVRA